MTFGEAPHPLVRNPSFADILSVTGWRDQKQLARRINQRGHCHTHASEGVVHKVPCFTSKGHNIRGFPARICKALHSNEAKLPKP
jgi:hypothetical protein